MPNLHIMQTVLPYVNIKYVSNTFLSFVKIGRLNLPYVDVAEWIGGLTVIRGLLSFNSDAFAIRRLQHVI